MALRVAAATDRAERERVFAFRYRVYVEELKMTDAADHTRKWLVDDLDDHSLCYAVFDGDEVLGSLRVTPLGDLPDPGPLREKFAFAPAEHHFGLAAMCSTSRFILDQRLRHGTVIFKLMRAAYRDMAARGVRLNYGDCSPHLLPFYEHLGYRRYTHGYNDTAYGYKLPILMLIRDRSSFEAVRSPLRRLAADQVDDVEARRWFEQTYPNYTRLETGTFLPDEVFFDLLSERIASDPLHAVFLLRGLSRDEADRFLNKATLLRLNTGDLIIRKGDHDATLFVLLKGLAEVRVGGDRQAPAAVFGAGDTFGEIGFLTAVPRTADVVATTTAEVLVLSGEFMERLLTKEPALGGKVLLNLARELAGRLASQNPS